MKQNREIEKTLISCIIFVCMATAFNAFLSYDVFVIRNGYSSCAMDGIYIWAPQLRLVSFLLIPITSYYCLEYIDRDFEPEIVVRHKSRYMIWLKQAAKCLGFCMIVILTDILLSFFIAWGTTGTIINYERGRSMYAGLVGLSNPDREIYMYLLDAVKVWVLNSMQLFSVILTGLLIYWLIQSRVVLMLIMVGLGYYELNNNGMFFSKTKQINEKFFTEIMNNQEYFIVFIRCVVLLCIIMAGAYFITRRKEFYNNVQEERQ